MKCFNQYKIDKLTVKDEIQFEIIDSLSMFFLYWEKVTGPQIEVKSY